VSRYHLWAVITAFLALVSPAQSQSDRMRGRCDPNRQELRMPPLNALGDSARLASILGGGANPRARLVFVELRFGKDGRLREVDVTRGASSSGRAAIRDSLRSLLRPIGISSIDVVVNVVRFNGSGQIRVFTATTTCRPEAYPTAETRSLISRIQRDAPQTNVRRDVTVEFILEADGQVSDAWVEFGSSYPRVDELALDIIKAQRFVPAMVGEVPVAAFIRQSVKF